MTLNPLKSNHFFNNFKRKSQGNCNNSTESASDNSDRCCSWHELNKLRGKVIVRKSNDPIPPEILRVQEKLDFRPGEPVTKRNLHKLLYVGRPEIDRRVNHVNPVVPPYVTPPYRQELQKKNPEKLNGLPVKRMYFDRNGVAVPVIMHSVHELEIIGVETKPISNPKRLSSV